MLDAVQHKKISYFVDREVIVLLIYSYINNCKKKIKKFTL
jgi:hypothetical protein